jgi:hypothetical protein
VSRKRKKDPPVPVSARWEDYRPDDDLYWRHGGPFVPVEEIPEAHYRYGEVGLHTKDLGRRAEYLRALIEGAEEDMARAVDRYAKLKEFGIDGMELALYREQDRKMEAEGGWENVARNVDRHRASCYRTIRMNKRKLREYREQVRRLDMASTPLLAGLD